MTPWICKNKIGEKQCDNLILPDVEAVTLANGRRLKIEYMGASVICKRCGKETTLELEKRPAKA